MGSFSNLSKTCLFLFSFLFAFVENVYSQPGVFNVMDFGAKADGTTDDAKAFLSAWDKACPATTKSKVLIPAGKYLSGTAMFKGPCKNPVEVQIDGTVNAPKEMSGVDDWIAFNYVKGLTVSGKGALDGQGTLAWSQNQCASKEKGGKCKFPVNLRFNFVTDATITGISSLNSKFFHINLLGTKNIKFHQIKISAPGNSINTDGIHIGDASGIEISDSAIGTGDDCVSMGAGTNNINIIGVTCGPGHGISIGSLGKYQKEETVTGVTVKNCTFTGTDNGVRIKTWPAGAAGTASNFTFEDLIMNNVKNPIVIDQEYCPYNACNKAKPSLIKISKVAFKNIRGTSATKEAVTLICSKGVPCEAVELSDINLTYNGKDGAATSICNNVKPTLAKNIFPPTCATSAI